MDYRGRRNDYLMRKEDRRRGVRGSGRGRDSSYDRARSYEMEVRPRDYYEDERRGRRDYYYEDERRGRDYADYAGAEKDYEHQLEKWTKKLMKRDKFHMPKNEIIKKAEEMHVEFEEYSEEEFYAVYLMMVSDYPNISNEPHMYIALAKQFLEDDDMAVSPSEKVCIYLYEIVLGGKED
jgi:hypothetical protein